MTYPDKRPYSPYRHFSLEEWGKLRQHASQGASQHTPLALSEQELSVLRGINERASIEEVRQVYLPLSRLLSLYVASMQNLNLGTVEFLGIESGKVPFIIGIAGSVAVGKSTVARILQTLLQRWPEHPKVDLITTDGYLFTTVQLEKKNLMHRKGFPESFDRTRLVQFLSDIKGGRRNLQAPVYSHLLYDVVPDKFVHVDQPDILIVEGLNVLQTNKLKQGEQQVFISDYFDFSIYIDAEEDVIKKWYVDRFVTLRDTVFKQPNAYFNHYATLNTEQARKTASEIWSSINLVNLRENILPSRNRAKLILHKSEDHSIDYVQVRKT